MRLLYQVSRLYRSYQKVMWISGLATTFGAPLVGYGMYALSSLKTKRSMLEDNPELANDISTVNPLEWVSHVQGWLPTVVRVLFMVGLFVSVCAVVGWVISLIAARTKISGVDDTLVQEDKLHERWQREDDEQFE